MRIGIEVSLLFEERSGIGQYIYHLVNGLGAIDDANEYVLFFTSLIQQTIPSELGSKYKNMSFMQIHCPKWPLYLATGLGRWQFPPLGRFVRSMDVFHWPNYVSLFKNGGKQIITVNDLTFQLYPRFHPWLRTKGLTSGIRNSALSAEAIIVPSEHTKCDVVKLLGIPEGRVRVIHDAASPRFRQIAISEREVVLSKYRLSGTSYLLFIGNMEPRKNLNRLLQAYHLLRQRWSCSNALVLVGGQGWRNAEIYRTVEQLALGREVRFLGYIPDEDLPYLMNAASLFVYPSLYEGFGLPPLEAMACGCPVITSNVSSLPEVVGNAALMVDPYDVEGLAEAMYRVLTDKNLAEEMRKRGLERAKLFSWEETARQTLKVYEEVYNRGRA